MADLKGYIKIDSEIIKYSLNNNIIWYESIYEVTYPDRDFGRNYKIIPTLPQDGSFTIPDFNSINNYIFFPSTLSTKFKLFGPSSGKLTILSNKENQKNKDTDSAKSAISQGFDQPIDVNPFPAPDSNGVYIFDLQPQTQQLREFLLEAKPLKILKLAIYNSDFTPLNIQDDLDGLDIAVLNEKLKQIAFLRYDQYSNNQYPEFINRIETKENKIIISYENSSNDDNPFIFIFSPKKENSPYSPLNIQPVSAEEQTQYIYSALINEKNTIIEEVSLVNSGTDSPKPVLFSESVVYQEEDIPSALIFKSKAPEVPYEFKEPELSIPSQFRVQLGTIIRRLISRIKDFIINGITRLLLEKLGVKPQILTFLIKKDFSNPAVIQLIRSLGVPLAIDPQILQDFFRGKIKLKDLPPLERKRILLALLPLLPPICPPQPILRQIVNIRNNILSSLETINSYIQSISLTIVVISTGLRLTKQTLLSIRAIRKIILLSAKALSTAVPPIRLPAPLDSVLRDLTELADNLKYAPQGTPKLDKLEELIKSVEPPLTLASSVIGQAVTLLNFVDFLLVKCSLENGIEENITPISEELIQAANRQQVASETLNRALYNGFIIEIEEVPFSPTVTRRKAVGINQSGIKLIETPLSFTTNPQFLIDELKFIIDRDNLKAY
jgi:hypothetical protein